jgi:hypothetical protein
LVAAAAVLAGIVVILRDKQGKEVGRFEVPPGGSVSVQDDGKGKDETKEQPAPKEGVPMAAAPLAALLPGEALSPTALVQHPAKLPGVRSWTIEPRDQERTTAVAYRPDGKRLAVGYPDGSVRVWEPESGRLVQMLLGSGSRAITSLAWSPDGGVLAGGTGSQTGLPDQEKRLVQL